MYRKKEKPLPMLYDYNFERPDKFNHDSLNSFVSIANTFERLFSQNFSASLRIPIEIDFVGIDQVPFGSEYIDKVEKEEYVFCITNMGSKDQQIIIELETGMSLSILRKLLGGDIGKIEKVKKQITDIEKIGLKHWLESQLTPALRESFETIGDFNFVISELENDPQYAKITLPSDMIALLTFDIKIGTEKCKLRMVFPYLSVETIIDKLTSENFFKIRVSETSEQDKEYLRSHVKHLTKQFTVELGKTKASIKELLELEIGNLLILDKYEKPIKAYVEGRPKFLCIPGKTEGKKGVTIVGTVYDEGKKIMSEKEWFSQEFIDDFLSKKSNISTSVEAQPVDLEELGTAVETELSDKHRDLELLYDVPLEIKVSFGQSYKTVNEILELVNGSIVKLDKFAGEPVDILIGDTIVANGEVMIYDDKFGVRVLDIVAPEQMLQSIKEDVEKNN